MENEQPQATLRDTLTASIEQHREEVPEAVAPVTEAAPAAPVTETAEQKAGRTAGRPRDEKGRLLPGKPEVAAPAAPVQAAPVTAESAPQPVPRPSSWEKGMWPIWDKLNAGVALDAKEARQLAEYNVKREGQFATGVSTYKSIAESAKPLLEAIQPFQADIEKYGLQAPQLIHSFMTAHRTLSLGSPQEKLQLYANLAQQYGIPLQALYDQNAQQQYLSTPHTPTPQAQAPQVSDEQKFEAYLAKRELNQTVESMAKDKEKYPFFQYVRGTMAQLLETGEATDLNDAYQKSLDHPDHAVFSTVQQQQQAQAAEQQRVAAGQATARVARANTVSPKTATPAAAAPTGKQGVRDALREAISQHAGGARV